MLQFPLQLPKWLTLLLLFPLIFLDGWLLYVLVQFLQPLVSIVVTALILSFLLDYPVRLLQSERISRSVAAALVFLAALVGLGALGFTLVPLLLEQSSEVAAALPRWLESGQNQLLTLNQSEFARHIPIDLTRATTQAIEKISSELQSLSSQVVSFVLGTVGSVINLLITLVLTIFLVLSGEKLWQGILSWLPCFWQDYLRSSLRQNFENYFAGQATLAAIFSGALIIAFLILGIPYALLFGLTLGMATFIPYASALSTSIVSVLLAFQDVKLGLEVLLTAIILGQIMDNVVAPRVLGNVTGLNPVWLIVSLLIGAKFGGVLGLLIVVPLASFIKRTVDKLNVMALDQPDLIPSDEGE